MELRMKPCWTGGRGQFGHVEDTYGRRRGERSEKKKKKKRMREEREGREGREGGRRRAYRCKQS
jgi:hypothetical protein